MPKCYIIDRATDTKVEAQYEPALKQDLSRLSSQGWEFPWPGIYSTKGVKVFKITLNGVIQGLLAVKNDIEAESVLIRNIESAPHNKKGGQYVVGPTLAAIAAKYSYDVDQDGYMRIQPKNKRLANYYISDLGGEPWGSFIHLYPKQSNTLINEYL